MSDIAIQVQGLGKRYALGGRRTPYKTLRESLVEAATAPFRRTRGAADPASPTSFWALRDVNFTVNRGEVVGIIGRNGAGKSTLLKVLSRITDPTEGQVQIDGRVGSLLEVGTGFHPELTGRENVYLNGAILGMRRAEIARQFDEIVAFAETEKFLDTPVKFYSSGMYTRLAFAVAAHLDPEILIVDEVLAVGDAAFQKKCLGKMHDVAAGGRTVLFVSHNMAAVTALCQTCVLLRGGVVGARGPAVEIAARYQSEGASQATRNGDLGTARRTGSGQARFAAITVSRLDPSTGAPSGHPIATGDDVVVAVRVQAGPGGLAPSNVAVIVYDAGGYRLIDVNTSLRGAFLQLPPGASGTATFRLRDVRLRPGTYTIGLWLGRANIEDIDAIEDAATFDVVPPNQAARHTETFPGPYQCRFDAQISPG